jgi:hypothetical protein
MKLVECMEDVGPQHVELTPKMRVLKRQGQIITTKAFGTSKIGVRPTTKDKNKLQM